MERRFVGREKELGYLEGRWREGSPELIVVYGRRRVGKTELLMQFARKGQKKTLYFLATEVTRKEHLRQFSQIMRTVFHEPILELSPFPTWEAVFNYLGEQARGERLLVILDEFPYLCEAAPELPSLLQKFWDLKGKESRLFLVLCGSHMGFMERQILSQKSPLYGRRTGQIRLQPFDFREAGLFFPGYSAQDQLMAYGMLGGMPAYLLRFSPKRSLRENLLQEMLQTQGYLYEEPMFLLRMELRDPKVYAGVLGAIASGCTKLNEISQRVGLSAQVVSKYLDVLQELGLVVREVPFTARAPRRNKKGRYRVVDPYLGFWFRFVQPYASLIESDKGLLVSEEFIWPHIQEYMGPVFERIAAAYLLRYAAEELGVPPVLRAGREWGGNLEIDVVASHADGSLSFGECKWSRRPVGEKVLRGLLHKVQQLSLEKGGSGTVRYFLFSCAGFDSRLRRHGENPPLFLVTPKQLLEKPGRG